MRSLLAVLALAALGVAQDNCQGTANPYPVYTGQPVFVSKSANGARYEIGPSGLEPKLTILHMKGTAYEMGVAYGTLMSNEINLLVPQTFEWIDQQISQYLQWLPEPVRVAVENFGIDFALNVTIDATAPHTPQHFIDTINGMANGTGIDAHRLHQMALFPELIKASCSILGGWSEATEGPDYGLLQLRALDWSTNGPFQQFPVILNYHPTDGGHDFTVMSWAGLVGAITGYSSAGLAVSEKVWLHYTGVQNIFGYPFHFLLQDILQFDIDMDQALSRVATANRTCSIFIGIGDHNNNYFKLLEYSFQEVNIFNDKNFPAYPPYHDLYTDLVFVDKHTQPSHDPCMNSLVQKYYGHFTPQDLIDLVSVFQTGDMHVAIYDYQNRFMYVSNASPSNGSQPVVPAYNRQFMQLNMQQMWNSSYALSA